MNVYKNPTCFSRWSVRDIFIEPAINREQKVYFDTECGIAYIDIECDNDIFNHLTAFKETHLFDTK